MDTPMAGSVFGAHDSYEWLVTEHALEDVLSICPELVVGKYLAITAADSGDLVPDSQQMAAGWKNSGRIAYSPKITSLNVLHQEGWDEWYVFGNETNLGRIADNADIFESPIKQGEVWRFVNFNLGLHRAEMNSLATWFWKQIETIQPKVYIADSDYHPEHCERRQTAVCGSTEGHHYVGFTSADTGLKPMFPHCDGHSLTLLREDGRQTGSEFLAKIGNTDCR